MSDVTPSAQPRGANPDAVATGESPAAVAPAPVAAGYDAPVADGAGESTARSRRRDRAVTPTRASALWTAVVVAAVVAIFLVIFIAQNNQTTSINFLWLHGRAPTSVALLIAAIAGAAIAIIVAVARIFQLRRAAKRNAAGS